MNYLNKITSTLLVLLISSATLYSQITIPPGGFTLPITPDTTVSGFFYNDGSVEAPGIGEDQVWDYSELEAESHTYLSYNSGDDNPNFSDADFMNYYGSYIGGIQLVGSREYFTQDDEGIVRIGFEIADNTYSLTSVTGGPNDELRTTGSHVRTDDNIVTPFPLNYEDSWSTSYVGSTPYELTVESFGLNQTPGDYVQHMTYEYEVVGWGSLSIGGNEYEDVPALLIKRTFHVIDSVMLNNEPAPQPMLDAFGIQQGATSSSQMYRFVVFDEENPVERWSSLTLRMNEDFSQVLSGSFVMEPYTTDDNGDNGGNGDTVSINETPFFANVNLYPNPATDNIEIALGKKVDQALTLNVFHMGGAKIEQKIIPVGSENIELHISEYDPAYYIIHLSDQSGKTLYTDKFLKR